ncbi:MAG: spermidine/putrescine ABC transporter substrate-binding protein [Anaerolineales bacterium]|uniref:Spermidine/putrescine ABC transporter substrate-binding protein n=1 Tax=Candidatus Desulfolinea nitratireducens TaxID=2841698 RepID=A0A8J6NIL4_9CHLR|nr:spermidine/putrescine ABC transporter substrate-binding protein [Candidatus Desulfolinea nitratireducens]MBL6959850.1 spermidine/putrescine ABC transporter substrate-binding protein [Anaerolineales bacterium]
MNHNMKVTSKFFQFAPILLLVLVSACAPAATPTAEPATEVAPVAESTVLNIYNWEDYMDDTILAAFEEEYGITINYTTYTSNEELIDVLMAGPVDYDLVVPSDYAVEFLRGESMFGSLDKTNIPNFANIAPTFINPSYDPGNRYCIPYQWGTTGIGYNIKATGKELTSWADVFDPAYAGRVSFIEEPREAFAAILLLLGHSPNSTNQIELDEATAFLKSNADHIATYAPDTGQDLLDAGEVDIAHEYNGDIFQIMAENPDIRYMIPSEGAMIWSDNLCLLASAPNKENAEKFMNYLLDAEVGAALSNYLRYASPNQAALPFLNEEDRNHPGLYPPEEVLARMFFFANIGSASQLYDDAWSEVLANHGQ